MVARVALNNLHQDHDESVRFVEAKEAGKHSASRLLDHHQTNAVKSKYKMNRRNTPSNLLKMTAQQ
jgi:hypothetical protein